MKSILQSTAPISAQQFGWFRLFLGTYLLVHFVQLLPYAEEVFGPSGVMGQPALNPIPKILPSPLWGGEEGPAFLVVLGGVMASLGLLLGRARAIFSVILWLIWAWLFGRNNLISNPSLPYVGLALLLTAIVPTGEGLVFGRSKRSDWTFPGMAWWAMWILLAAGYTFSGWCKLASPSWIDGTALSDVMANPLARPGFARELFLLCPDFIPRFMTWGTLSLELSFLPLALIPRLRPWLWWLMIFLHLGIIFLIDFADLSVGMLVAHLFVFRPDWLPKRWLPRIDGIFRSPLDSRA